MSIKFKRLFIAAAAAVVCAFISLVLVACNPAYVWKFMPEEDTDAPASCTVVFDADGGTIFGESSYAVKVEGESKLSAPTEEPVRTDFEFVCWSMVEGNPNARYDFETDNVKSDLVLYAVWARICTVAFDADGGTVEGDDTYEVKLTEGGKITAPDVVAPEKRELDGWYNVNGEKWDFDVDIVNDDTMLTAKWVLASAIVAELEPYYYTDEDGVITITGVKDRYGLKSAVVPSGVTAIGDRAFLNCTALKEVVLHDGIESIGVSAFDGCDKLESVTLPSGLKRLSNRMFYGCYKLESIDLPDTVDEVGEMVFANCFALQSMTLPAGVTEIAYWMFRGCSSLKSVSGGAVTRIAYSAFKECSLLEYDIPSAVTEIDGEAFCGCKSIKSVVVPAACGSVGRRAFADCTSLTTVTLNCAEIDHSAFENCTALNNLTLGSGVRKIGEEAFFGCTALEEVNVPDGVTELNGAFGGCTWLKRATLGQGVTEIKSNTFADCVALRQIELKGNITKIESNAFKNCLSLTSFTVPQSVASFSSTAFNGCKRFKEIVNLSQANVTVSGCNTVTKADDSAFVTVDGFLFYPRSSSDDYILVDYVGSGENLTLPESCNGNSYDIGDYAFAYNTSINSIAIPACVGNIGNYMIAESKNVTVLTVAAGNAFFMSHGNCIINKNTKSLILGCNGSVIPDDAKVVTSIAANAFYRCLGLESLTIPDNIASVADKAFVDCDKIFEIEGNIKYVDSWALDVVYGFSSSVTTLRLRSGTVGVADRFVEGDNAGERRQKNISKVTFSDELKHIGNYAFSNCTNLADVKLNDGLVDIGERAFYCCDGLYTVIVPKSVKAIGENAFNYCSGLTTIVLNEGLTKISSGLFANCRNLSGVVIPSTVTEIEKWAFSDCPDSITVYYGGSDFADWQKITISEKNNGAILDFDRYSRQLKYYSETRHLMGWYFEDGLPKAWN